MADHFYTLKLTNRYYFFSTGVSAFLSTALSFLPFVQHSFFAFLVLSLTVEADTVEAAKPIVKVIAKIIANLFILSILCSSY